MNIATHTSQSGVLHNISVDKYTKLIIVVKCTYSIIDRMGGGGQRSMALSPLNDKNNDSEQLDSTVKIQLFLLKLIAKKIPA